MKTKIKNDWGMLRMHLPSLLLLISLSLNSSAQWTTNANNIYNSNSGNVGVGTTAPASKFQVIGESRFGAAANYAKVSSTGTLSFTGSGAYYVSSNKYVFKQATVGNRGLYFNQTSTRFELRDSTAQDLFHVDYYTGDVYHKGNLAIGTTNPVPPETRVMLGGYDNAEGGRIGFSSPTSGYTTAWYMDVWGNDFRIMDGTNVQSQNVRLFLNSAGTVGLNTGNSALPAESNLVLGGLNFTEGGQLQLNRAYTKSWFLDVSGDNFRIKDGSDLGSVNEILVINPWFGVVIGDGPLGQKFIVHTITSSGQHHATLGWVHNSDARLKTNIKPLENALDKIVKLQGVSFNWKTLPGTNNQIGFIAQEVEKVFPEVIIKDAEGNYSMAIQNLVAPIVEALKLQQQQIDETGLALDNLQHAVGNLQNETALLKSGVNNLEQGLSQCCLSNSMKTINAESVIQDNAKLEQNSPNPFNEKTIVRCYIPQSASNAVIKIYSIKGEEIKSIPVNAKGINELEIAGSTLAAGTYNYLLIIDGKTIDRKLMIVTK